ncbi:ABC transporter transmembrane domain-containing protein [Aliivibrio salmonicida]|uniref:ABC transporter transmembrane domain-containing protein n=1 Tax=Aliivibrio salmonicida TaxID=40269 RepID=UPI001F5C349A|nr:ABC transporter transmembrane domain-containing protein [Aliivibrio salmonicida]
MMNKLHYLPRLGFFDAFFLFASSLTTTLLGLVLPFSILIIFDRILPNNSSSSLYFIFAIILIAIFLDYKVKNLEEAMVSRIGNRFEKKITNQLFHAICHSNLSLFTRLETGEYLERLTTIPGLKSFFSGDLIRSAINAFTCLITLLVISLINPGAGLF